MQNICCAVNESIVVDGHTTITIVDIGTDEVTFHVSRSDGTIERVSLPCVACESNALTDDSPALAAHELVAC